MRPRTTLPAQPVPPPAAREVEPVEDFLARLEVFARDWRYSDEFIGMAVRSRWPRDYA